MKSLKRFYEYVLGSALLVPAQIYAVDLGTCNAAPPGTPGCGTSTLSGVAVSLINTLIVIVGAVSVIMIVVGGLRYALSAGDSSATKGAKDTILYALIGLVVAAAAWAIASFIAGRVS